MAKILISPGKYIQGSGEMKRLGNYASGYGKKALVPVSYTHLDVYKRQPATLFHVIQES